MRKPETCSRKTRLAIRKAYGGCNIMPSVGDRRGERAYQIGFRVSADGSIFRIKSDGSVHVGHKKIRANGDDSFTSISRLQAYQKYGEQIYLPGALVLTYKNKAGRYDDVLLVDEFALEYDAINPPIMNIEGKDTIYNPNNMTEETWPLALKEAITKVYGACTIMLATKEKLEQKYYDAGYRVSESGEVFILYNGESISRTTVHCPSVGPAITPARLQSYQKYGGKIYEEGMFVIHARGSHGAYKGVFLTDVNGTEVIAVHEPVTKPVTKRLPKRSDAAPLYTKADTEQKQTDDSTTVLMTVDEMIQYLKKQGYKVFKPRVEYVEI